MSKKEPKENSVMNWCENGEIKNLKGEEGER